MNLTNLFYYILYFRHQMKDVVKKACKYIITGLLILAMGVIIANKAVFFHVHKLNDGKIVSHAHPFNKSDDAAPFKKHQHSKNELNLFSHVDLLFFMFLHLPAVILNICHRVYRIFADSLISRSTFMPHQGRAPPKSC